MEGAELKQLQATCKALRGEMTALYEQRGGRHSDEARLKERRWRVLLLLGAMKSGLRDTFLEADNRRTRVQEQKDVAEAHQLQLQNLLYEKDHLLREIRRCRGFSTKEMDKIEFVDGDLPIEVDAEVHRQHLDQLTQELHARKRLQTELKEIKLKIAKVEDATETKQAFLNALPDHLAGIEAATTGLQKFMGEPVTSQRNRHRAAGVELPTPLYALYCELEAYQTASGDAGKQLALEIVDAVGVKHAGAFRKRGFPAALDRQEQPTVVAKRLKAPSRSPSTSAHGATPPPQSRAPSRSPSAKRGAAQEPENGEIVAAHTAEKLLELRPHVSPSEEEETKEEESEHKHSLQEQEESTGATSAPAQNLWKPHAKALQLTVSVAIPLDADKNGHATKNVSSSFTVMFQYFPVAKIVTAEVVKSVPASFNHGNHQRSILMNLFPSDDGLTVPQLAVNYAFQEDSDERTEVEFPANAICRPYYWAHWICGLDPMKRPDTSAIEADNAEEKPRRRPEPSVRNVMNQLVKRFVATAVLKKHLDQLTKSTGASRLRDDGAQFVHPLARHLFPHEVKTHLEEWQEVVAPPQDVFQLFRENAAPSSRPRAQFHLPTTGCRYFRASFKNGQTNVSAMVEISPEYPVRAPRFLFQQRSTTSSKAPVYENQLKELEIEVNAYYDELVPKGSEHFLLLHQLRKIELCFDVLCNAAANGEADVSLCFGRERRGKDRRQALVMDTAAKELRHR
ncbi:hypothetical protein PHMEG_00087 [Phytophthora megakarya]|uniref:THO complex subunit 5 n=1 Tax=Phytophthora megakarya TaxID=4795 RepID=A0A225X4W6_9STRA|nr:hypothetical protein PHMEG_00087 [Phytophthora megakarya]